jgi:probable HAF family extracellular repeat protein
MSDLGALYGMFSFANGINDSGQVVGSSSSIWTHGYHAFITGPNGIGMTDLGTLGGPNSEAYDINDFGEVLGGLTSMVAILTLSSLVTVA